MNFEGNFIALIGVNFLTPLKGLKEIDLRNNTVVDKKATGAGEIGHLQLEIHLIKIEKILINHEKRLEEMENNKLSNVKVAYNF